MVESFRHEQRTKNEERRTKNVAGFTLVEVTLSAVVISMGLLALFGLGHLALQNAKSAEDATRSAMLADDLVTSLRTVSEELCASNNPSAWAGFWTTFASGNQPLPILPPTATAFSNQFADTVWGGGRTCTNYFFSRPEIHKSGLPAVPEWSARYWMDIELTNSLGLPAPPDLARVTLHIVPGFSGSMGESHAFYTHFSEHGTLP